MSNHTKFYHNKYQFNTAINALELYNTSSALSLDLQWASLLSNYRYVLGKVFYNNLHWVTQVLILSPTMRTAIVMGENKTDLTFEDRIIQCMMIVEAQPVTRLEIAFIIKPEDTLDGLFHLCVAHINNYEPFGRIAEIPYIFFDNKIYFTNVLAKPCEQLQKIQTILSSAFIVGRTNNKDIQFTREYLSQLGFYVFTSDMIDAEMAKIIKQDFKHLLSDSNE